MKKTLRKALACLLAVLMVVLSVPFSALAAVTVGQGNQIWWTDEDLPISKAPTYTAFNANYTFGSRELNEMQLKSATNNKKRWNYKPVIGVTVSNLGTAESSLEEMDSLAASYYGAGGLGWAAAQEAGNIIDPTDVKAGQRVAVTLEFGGFDIFANGAMNTNYDNTKIKAAGYWDLCVDNGEDTWVVDPEYSAHSTNAYAASILIFPNVFDDAAIVGMGSQAQTKNEKSCSIIPGSDEIFDARFDGIVPVTFFYEVQEDCDLTEVITFDEDYTYFQVIPQPILIDNKIDRYFNFTLNETPETSVRIAPVSWTNASGGGSTECTHANLTATPEVPATCLAAGTAAYWTCNDCGKMFSDASATTEISAPTTLGKLDHSYTGAIKSNGDGTHSYLCVNGCNQYGGKVNCTFGEMSTVKPPTIAEEGIGRYTCGDCGYYYEVTLDKVTCTHEHTEIRDAKPETCTAPGYSGDTWCLDCGEKIATGSPIDKKAHTPGTATQEDVIDSTCSAEGSYNEVVRCTVCKEIISSTPKTLAKKAHTPGTAAQEDVIDSTCSAEGSYNEVVRCTVCNNIISSTHKTLAKKDHTPGAVAQENVVPAELDKDGSYDDVVRCTVCNEVISSKHQIIPALKGYTVKVDAVDLGTVTLNGEDVTAGAAKRVLAGSKVILTATPVEGATFVGWVANGSTTVSTDTTFVATALADITYTPVFAIDKADEFTVTFVDSFGNVVSAQTVTSGSAIVVPAAPSRPGYSAATENGWSMTNDEIAALTASATITAQYVQDAEKTFTVTATGCNIAVNGVTTADTATDVAYDTLVTVTAADAKAWAINGVTVAYGDTYTFFVSSDVTLTKVVDAVTATPTIANVSKTTTGATGAVQAVFTATRSMTDDCTFVDAGFVYGKGDLGEITLDDVTGTTVKAAYVKTPVEQFSLVYGLRAQTGSITARAFLAYVDAEGNSQVIYADPQTFTY